VQVVINDLQVPFIEYDGWVQGVSAMWASRVTNERMDEAIP
jgi:hypothetical protein